MSPGNKVSITEAMRELSEGEMDLRTGKPVSDYLNWTGHPNNPMATTSGK